MPRLVPTLLVFVAIAILASCGAPTPPAGGGTAPDAVIAGTLIDASGAPLIGQQVTLTPATAPSPSSTSVDAVAASAAAIATTDARGAFGFDVAEPGTFVLTNVGDTTGAMARVMVERAGDGRLTSGGSVGLTALELGAVTGRVADRGAGVLVFLSGTSFVAMTGSDGTFAISRVPAGSYDALASVAGAIGASVPVTVAAGGTAALTTALRVGPVIASVTPAGFVPVVSSLEDGGVVTDPAEFVITGSGFGAELGVSRVTYGGCEVPVEAVTSWSATRIAVDTNLLNFFSCYVVDAEDLRFALGTPAGTARSPVVGAYALTASVASGYGQGSIDASTPVPVSAGFGVYPFFIAEGVALAVEASNGTVQDLAGAPLSTWTTVEYDYGAPAFQVVPSSWLPVVLTLDPTADPRVTGAPKRFALRAGSIFVDNDSYVPGANTFSGTVVTEDGVTPMPDDGSFRLRFFTSSFGSCAPEYEEAFVAEQALAIAADGTWSADVTLPDVSNLQMALTYDGVFAACASLWPLN